MQLYELDFLLPLDLSPSGCHHFYEGTQGLLRARSVISHVMKRYAKKEDVFQLAANLAEKIMKNHAFQDRNKHTAYWHSDIGISHLLITLLPGSSRK